MRILLSKSGQRIQCLCTVKVTTKQGRARTSYKTIGSFKVDTDPPTSLLKKLSNQEKKQLATWLENYHAMAAFNKIDTVIKTVHEGLEYGLDIKKQIIKTILHKMDNLEKLLQQNT